jgi:hypothetical protein
MRKMHAAFLAGAVVVGLGVAAGLAPFAPSLIGQKSATHELTLRLPGGGAETIAYTGNVPPSVTFHQARAAFWPASFYDWTMPPFVAPDRFIADMDKHLQMLANRPLLIPPVPEQPQNMVVVSSLPAGTSYSIVSETSGDGVCTHFAQITKAAGDAKPQIVSQTSGNCVTGSDKAVNSQPTQSAKRINLPSTSGQAITQTM